jgi:uncharacterized protein YndB with AHSA1/START domain
MDTVQQDAMRAQGFEVGAGVGSRIEERPSGFTLEWQVFIAATPERVWQALTKEVHSWWEHSFSEKPVFIGMEPVIGGRFFEQFDTAGHGALYATVIYSDPPRMLRYTGNMGMRGAVVNTSTYALEGRDGGTLLHKRMEVLGDVPPDVQANYRQGGARLQVCIKDYIERGVKVR